jgi:hypothetical protein
MRYPYNIQLTARVKCPNTAVTDSQGEVWHVVTFPDGEQWDVLATDPQDAIETVRDLFTENSHYWDIAEQEAAELIQELKDSDLFGDRKSPAGF